MRFFLSIATFASLALTGLSLVACSNDESVAGIEIGNPSIDPTADKDSVVVKDSSEVDTIPVVNPQDPSDDTSSVTVALPLTANFVVDYEKGFAQKLAKEAEVKEAVLLDTFDLELTNVRTYNSIYVAASDTMLTRGLTVWPYEGSEDEVMSVSFTRESYIDESFRRINLLPGADYYLKEIGVSFRPTKSHKIYGRALIDGDYVPFVYNLKNFQALQLRYHYSQIEIDSVKNVANLLVEFRAKKFVESLDFSKAEISDGVIVIDDKSNTDLWKTLNDRFIPSFQPLRYKHLEAGKLDTAGVENVDRMEYVNDIWKNIAAGIGENTLINGNFKSPFTADWIFKPQMGGKADTTIVSERSGDRIMKVTVTEGGNNSYSVQLLQENVALIAGVKYVCVFTIWSDVADSITARIGSYSSYESIGFSEHVAVGKTGQSVQIEFTPEVTDPFARFELNLGKKIRTFWIKEVQVLRLSK